MLVRKFASIAVTFLMLCAIAFGQAQPSATVDPDKAKKQKDIDDRIVAMLDQSVAETNALRLSQNRAVIYAMTGDLYWKYDSKRSRELFRNAAAELTTFNGEVEKEKRENTDIGNTINTLIDYGDPTDPRTDILNIIAGRDPDLAIELMRQTRSASIAEAMAKAAATPAPVVDPSRGPQPPQTFNPETARAAQETAMEQRFNMLAAYTDPDRSVNAIKESLAKGISANVIGLLQALNKTDEKRAADMSDDVVKRVLDGDLAKNDELNGVMSFLQYISRASQNQNQVQRSADGKPVKQFAFTESQSKDIANKLANAFLQTSTTPELNAALTRSLPSFEKVLPEKIVLLKQRDAQNKKNQPAAAGRGNGGGIGSGQGSGAGISAAKYFDPNTTAEDVLAAASKLTNELQKQMAYSALTAKISQITDDSRAKKLIDQIPDDKVRATAAEQFEANRITRLTQADKLDEARKAINALPNKKVRVQKLVALANQFQRKGDTNSIETARGIMSDAKALVNPVPDDEDDLADVMEVIRGYTNVDPDTAFRLFEPLIDPLNEVTQASATLSKYNKRDRTFKKGEMVMRPNGNFGGLLLFRYTNQIQMLGRADLEHMSTLTDRFTRSDARAIIKLYVLQGYVKNVGQLQPIVVTQ